MPDIKIIDTILHVFFPPPQFMIFIYKPTQQMYINDAI